MAEEEALVAAPFAAVALRYADRQSRTRRKRSSGMLSKKAHGTTQQRQKGT
jgi:hypothetical protein